MQIEKGKLLTEYNTFGIAAKAAYFCEISSIDNLIEVYKTNKNLDKFILSGGSNMLITQNIDALVLYMNTKGKQILSEDKKHIQLKVMGGENWHQLVLWTLEQGYGGLENLSLIPGKIGTAPIQNIGAYGVELKDTFISCEALNTKTLTLETFSKKDCEFGYRNSFFKKEGKGNYIITSVTLQLTKENHRLNTSYGAIEDELQNNNIINPTIKDVSNAVIAIRSSKLPDPKELGNSGSFFKNPVITKNIFENFTKKNPEAPFYKISEDEYKIPAGWLIEQCGFKGKKYGDAGVHKNQALVLVNHGNATGQELLNLAHKISEKVKANFGIEIIPEVNVIK